MYDKIVDNSNNVYNNIVQHRQTAVKSNLKGGLTGE